MCITFSKLADMTVLTSPTKNKCWKTKKFVRIAQKYSFIISQIFDISYGLMKMLKLVIVVWKLKQINVKETPDDNA
jgi:hypothetical protein